MELGAGVTTSGDMGPLTIMQIRSLDVNSAITPYPNCLAMSRLKSREGQGLTSVPREIRDKDLVSPWPLHVDSVLSWASSLAGVQSGWPWKRPCPHHHLCCMLVHFFHREKRVLNGWHPFPSSPAIKSLIIKLSVSKLIFGIWFRSPRIQTSSIPWQTTHLESENPDCESCPCHFLV